MNIQILELIRTKYAAERALYIQNVKNLLSNPAGVADHPDIAKTIESQLIEISRCSSMIEATFAVYSREQQTSEITACKN